MARSEQTEPEQAAEMPQGKESRQGCCRGEEAPVAGMPGRMGGGPYSCRGAGSGRDAHRPLNCTHCSVRFCQAGRPVLWP